MIGPNRGRVVDAQDAAGEPAGHGQLRTPDLPGPSCEGRNPVRKQPPPQPGQGNAGPETNRRAKEEAATGEATPAAGRGKTHECVPSGGNSNIHLIVKR